MGTLFNVDVFHCTDIRQMFTRLEHILYTACQNDCAKLFAPVLIIVGRKMAKRLKLCKVHSFSTLPNSHHHTTVLNTNVPNCMSHNVESSDKNNLAHVVYNELSVSRYHISSYGYTFMLFLC